MYLTVIKPSLDFLFALIGLICIIPIGLIIVLFVWLFQGRPIFFFLHRPGKDGKIFTLWKFRSMKNGHGPDQERITAFGAFLRKTSLDELPQLWNILSGDMSWIGPRPLLCSYLPLYSEEQNKRHQVKPGLIGLAQVKGRNAQTWQERFFWDVYYVKNLSFIMDFKIVIASLGTLLRMDGNHSMEPFKGNS